MTGTHSYMLHAAVNRHHHSRINRIETPAKTPGSYDTPAVIARPPSANFNFQIRKPTSKIHQRRTTVKTTCALSHFAKVCVCVYALDLRKIVVPT
jgi:hypothetical protein